MQEQKHIEEKHAAQQDRAEGWEAQDVAVARLVGHVMGRVIAAHQSDEDWSTKVQIGPVG